MTNIGDVRQLVFERDEYRCRIPWCQKRASELAHLKARGMGGMPSRDTTDNTVAACHDCHQGTRSLHSGHIKWQHLTSAGADGPMAWTYCEKLPKAECSKSWT